MRGGAERIGILGGTLDPIHAGHLGAARAAREALRLDRIVVMPSRVPPHRAQGPAASPYHRFAMAALAITEEPGMDVSDEELCAEGPSYTAHTLERLAGNGLLPSQIFFITGADAFAEIDTWYRYPAVLDLAQFVVVSRPGLAATAIGERLPDLRGRMRLPGDAPAERDGTAIFLVDAPTPDVSSTEIRRRLRAGAAIDGLVPPAVDRHIRRHRLYLDDCPAAHLQR